MNNLTKMKLAWKYRRPLWKYRKVIRHRNKIGGLTLAMAMIGAGILVRRRRIESLSVQHA
jgi:hypothetical protein